MAGAFVIFAGLASALLPALAEARPSGGFVTAYSRYGNGALQAPVRIGTFGPEVRLPGGSWIECQKTGLLFGRNRPCAETLRRHSLDFWETREEDQGGR